MTTRPAFSNPALEDGVLSIGGESVTPGAKGGDVPATAELVSRHIAFAQGGNVVTGEASGGSKGWSATLDAPGFVKGETATAMGIEIYLDSGDSPRFLAFPWEQTVTVE